MSCSLCVPLAINCTETGIETIHSASSGTVAMASTTCRSEFGFMPSSAWKRAASIFCRIVLNSFAVKELVREFFSSSFSRSASVVRSQRNSCAEFELNGQSYRLAAPALCESQRSPCTNELSQLMPGYRKYEHSASDSRYKLIRDLKGVSPHGKLIQQTKHKIIC
jgi:hypothetical protein